MQKIPDKVLGMRIRKSEDCSIYIPRSNKAVEAILDRDFQRVPNQLKWFPIVGVGKNIDDLKDKYKGCDGYIIGKGPSLDNISKDIFTSPDAIIIAINEAVYKIESLDLPNDIFGLQCDALLRNTCKPDKSPMLISHHIQYFYPKLTNKYIFSYADHIIHAQSLSSQICLSLLKMMGVGYIKMVAFDACVEGSTSYADCIGHPPEGDAQRFRTHCNRIHNTVRELQINVDWHPVIQEAPAAQISDTPLPSSDSPTEHHVHVQSESLIDSQGTVDQSSETESSPHDTPPDHSDTPPQA